MLKQNCVRCKKEFTSRNALLNHQSKCTQSTFFQNLPVTSPDERVPRDANEPIRSLPQQNRSEALKLPSGFKWCSVDPTNAKQLEDLHNFLSQHYVEDDTGCRLEYSKELLLWALTPPGWQLDWYVGVRLTSGQLVGFISGLPCDLVVRGQTVPPTVSSDFLCVHKHLRGKRLAPVLISEGIRRIQCSGRSVVVCTVAAEKVPPQPVATVRWYHRWINLRKLVRTGFAHLRPQQTLSMMERAYAIPETMRTALRIMTEADVKTVHDLLAEHLQRFALYTRLSVADIRHWLLPREGLLSTWVADTDGRITDLLSFYSLPESLSTDRGQEFVQCACLNYAVAGSTSLTQLLADGLVLAKRANFDVMNCLDIADYRNILKPLNFKAGTGVLNYYFYNWRCATLANEEVALQLL